VTGNAARGHPYFYGWNIVGVGFLAHFACAFFLSSTLSVFLKPLTTDLEISRGVFSLLRSGEYLIIGALAPLVGSLLDRHGGRWLMAFGALISGTGLLLLSQVQEFWQFLLIRWALTTVGSAFICHLVINVSISCWFVRKRGRAIAIANLGQGIAKVSIPLITASLFVWLGWRATWGVFGIIILVVVIGPAIVFMRRHPEDLGLTPDGLLTHSPDFAARSREENGHARTFGLFLEVSIGSYSNVPTICMFLSRDGVSVVLHSALFRIGASGGYGSRLEVRLGPLKKGRLAYRLDLGFLLGSWPLFL